MNRFFLGVLCVLAFAKAELPQAQNPNISPLVAKDYIAQKEWVDSVYNQLSTRERIAQLFMVDAFTNRGKADLDKVRDLVRFHKIGGVIFSKGGPGRQAKFTNEIQDTADVPLLIAMDAEWGLAMRLDSTYAFPWNMTLGADRKHELSYEVGKRIGEHSKRLGVHINFAPDVDINTNPLNPIIGNRSFGEDKINVTEKASAFMRGMQSTGTLACAKHFPGHGDTDQDSHKILPTVDFTAERIDSVELYPYRRLISEGLASAMVAHLNIPSLESRNGYPTSISEKVVTGMLKEKLGFQGLIFTDALNMKGASNFSEPGQIDLQAFKAGNDVMLISKDIPKAITVFEMALANSEITAERLEHSVKKILMSKYLVGLNNYQPINTENLHADLNREIDDVAYEKAMERSITLLKNEKKLVPIKNLETKRIAYVSLGDDSGLEFYRELNKYTRVEKIVADQLSDLMTKLEPFNTVIVGFHRSNDNPWKSYKIDGKELNWLYEIARKHDVIFSSFVNPYMLAQLRTTTNFETIVQSYQNSEITQKLTAQMIFGARAFKGRLPVTSGEFKVGSGMDTQSIGRLSYSSSPSSAGFNADMVAKIDSIANHTINRKGAPGIQILVARKGKVVLDKNYGYHTYSKKNKVEDDEIYDVASVTKIIATLPLVMELVEQGRLDLDDPITKLDTAFASSNKKDITLRKMLSHYAQLKPWIPFYAYTLDSLTQKRLDHFYASTESNEYNLPVARDIFAKAVILDTINTRLKESDLLKKKEYKYSDLPYYILKDYLERTSGRSLDELTQSHFYQSMGMVNTGYRPLEKFSIDRIVPTEDDKTFRNQLLQGYVHDQGAAMQGGIGGHAGLFSNKNDLAIMMQMFLQGGFYGGRRYFKESTIDEFNTCYYCEEDVRRGVGFDKPQLEEVGPTCGCLSKKSFGHSGFTGAYVWADPDEEIVYVFLSNRVHPDAGNRFLITENIRTNIQQIIYDSIID
ncbi:beta-N-acetylglucosaminidase [Nonlabens spongiae]|uniref:beta-N-acetylhexosaminidase n=1 Tax=Nonlabens spongiae TaxID=331648 RepID=A0A1W6MJL1_9FLAO|nr:glycoside hydrolase family 3 N-terminal domain-containing protein [Nonlabens spongiae]ARN77791.1 beta-N-acetylglucosaminidase [Nonlabens spongiae]